MFERFSSGYYLGRLYVQPGEGETPRMCRTQHERVTERLYDRDVPPVMKLGRTHFPVRGGEVPADTLAVPPAVLEQEGVTNPPTLTEVFLAKADRAAQLLGFSDPDTDPGPDSPAV